MNQLNESQTDLIIQWVKSNHLTIISLENEFIDHICCDIEELMKNGKSFKAAFECLKKETGDDLLPGLEKQTIILLTYNQRIMKLMTRLTGIIVLFSFFTAIISRFFGFEYWKTLMAGGMFILGLVFAPLFFMEHYQKQEVKSQKVLHVFGFLAAFLIPLSSFMSLLDSPFALTVMDIGIVFLLLGFIPLSFLTVSKGPARTAFTGSILFLLFLVLMAFGLMGVRVSKDRINSWVFISRSSEQSSMIVDQLNLKIVSEQEKDTISKKSTTEIVEKSDILVNKIGVLRNNFILQLDPAYIPGNEFFRGMDNHSIGNDLLLKSSEVSRVLLDIKEYEEWLIILLSEKNDNAKLKISGILKPDFNLGSPDIRAQKDFLFRDFPAIAQVSVLNSMILNIRMAEFHALNFLAENNSRKF